MRKPPGRLALALLAACTLSWAIGPGTLAAQEAKTQEPSRLEKLLAGAPPAPPHYNVWQGLDSCTIFTHAVVRGR